MTSKIYPYLKIAFYVLLILSGTIYLGCAAEEQKDQDKELYNQIELFSDTITIIQSDYVKKLEPKALVYGALEGMLSSLDGYSQFMDPESFREMEIETKGEFGGLGIEIGIRDGILTIIAPIDGTPAEEAGLKSGDKIVKIDGELTKNITLMEAVKKLRGKPKTKVELSVLRKGEEKLLEFTIVRSIIKLKSIKMATMLDEKTGYIKLIEFQKNTPEELEEDVSNLKKDGMKALVLDLRNNPGGLLEVAYEVSGKFLEEGKIVVSLKGRTPKENKVYKSCEKRSFTDFPMVVLVNEGSASASEIVAGAIQDNRRGIILGSKTFGKGSVQTVIPLKDGSAVRITTAAYHTPNGRCINETGIIPDIEIELREAEEKSKEKPKAENDIFEKLEGEKKEEPKKIETPLYDSQLTAAVNLLKGILLYQEQPPK